MIFIQNGYIKTMAGADIENGCILLGDDGKIAAIGAGLTAPAGAEIIDAEGRLVTPGCVEAHCHIGCAEEIIGDKGSDHNESSDPVTPQLRAIDAIRPEDGRLADARRGGVTTLCTGPGSANVVCGTFAAIKPAGNCVDDMVVKFPVGMKCAFGENPKTIHGGRKKAPITRMATAALLRELLFKAREYMEAKDAGKEPKFDMKLEAMLPVMRGEIPLKAHAHRTDDILTAIRIAQEFGVKLTMDHCTEGHMIAEKLATYDYPALVGPSFGSKSKPELSNKTFETPPSCIRQACPSASSPMLMSCPLRICPCAPASLWMPVCPWKRAGVSSPSIPHGSSVLQTVWAAWKWARTPMWSSGPRILWSISAVQPIPPSLTAR